jgi:hypothetical protein
MVVIERTAASKSAFAFIVFLLATTPGWLRRPASGRAISYDIHALRCCFFSVPAAEQCWTSSLTISDDNVR